ncbi:hypothetical protein D9M68_716870 [compost metagenome]
MRPQEIELRPLLRKLVEGQTQVDCAAVFITITGEIQLVEFVDNNKIDILQVITLEHPFLSEQIDVGNVRHSLLALVGDHVAV